MRPLSIINYYSNNKKRFLSIFISVTLSVILIYTIQMVIFSFFRTGYNTAVGPKTYFSTISPKGQVLNEHIISTVSEAEGVDRIIPCVFDSTAIHAGIGSVYYTSIYSVKTNMIPELMELMKLKLVEGKLPQNRNQIILHKQVAANKNLKIGDCIGRMVTKSETLPGRYLVVGIIDGPSIVSFAPIEYYINTFHLDYDYIYGGIILPKEGELDIMNAALDEMDPADYQIDTLNIQEAFQENYATKISIFFFLIDFFIILIVSSCIGFLCYIYFSQRRSEFGLLWAIGFSKQQVINRAFAEINIINLAGYLSGLILSFLFGAFLNWIYFIPIGDYLKIFDTRYFLGAACSPIFITLFSLIPIWRMLKKLDPISIIDGTTI